MNWRSMSVVAAGVLLLLAGGCAKKQADVPQSDLLGQEKGSAAGLTWSIPKRWAAQGQRTMRVATYTIPVASGDAEVGECAVFYFGADQGGSVEMNIDRWASQFEQAKISDHGSKEVNGIKVVTVQISGTYLAPSGPMMESSGKKENFVLHGAIVVGPQGPVFFKATGPAKTMESASPEFDALVASVHL